MQMYLKCIECFRSQTGVGAHLYEAKVSWLSGLRVVRTCAASAVCLAFCDGSSSWYVAQAAQEGVRFGTDVSICGRVASGALLWELLVGR